MPKIDQPDKLARLALNVFDLMKLDQGSRAKLLAGKLGRGHFRVSRRGDDLALPLECEDLGAALAVDLCRSRAREMGFDLRAYLREDGEWALLPASAVLTLSTEGGIELSGRWFGAEHGKMRKTYFVGEED